MNFIARILSTSSVTLAIIAHGVTMYAYFNEPELITRALSEWPIIYVLGGGAAAMLAC